MLKNTSKIIGYIRTSTDKQDLKNQQHEILSYTNKHDLKLLIARKFIKSQYGSPQNHGISWHMSRVMTNNVKKCRITFFGVAPLDLNSTALGLGVKFFYFPKTHFYIFDMSISSVLGNTFRLQYVVPKICGTNKQWGDYEFYIQMEILIIRSA